MNRPDGRCCKLLLRALTVLAVVVVDPSLHAQEARPIVLDSADMFQGRVVNGEEAQELVGHVRLRQGNVRINCDSAFQLKRTGNVSLNGHVVVTDDSVTLTAPRGAYFRQERIAEGFDHVELDDGKVHLTAGYGKYLVEPRVAFFRENVLVRDTGSVITADSLTYYRSTRISEASGVVTIYNTADNVTIHGGLLENDAGRAYSRVLQHPVLLQIDTAEDGRLDTLFVRSRVMESYRDSVKRLIATDSVRILRTDLAAVAQRVEFYTVGDSILLRKEPVVWYQRTQVGGDSINVYLRQRRLDRVLVMGSAVAVSQSDSLRPLRLDQLTGERMQLYFASQKLRTIDVETRAISIYHLYEDSLANGLNRTSGDRIIMQFDDGKLNTIRIIGGVEGNYFPENMVQHREREYRVPGFFWRDDKPAIRDFGERQDTRSAARRTISNRQLAR